MNTELASGEALRDQILKDLKDLPSMPHVVFRAQEILANPEAGLRELTSVIETDQAIAATVLRIANSAYFGMSGRIASLQQATMLLGGNVLGKVITMAGISGLLGRSLPGYQLKSGDLWRHSVAVATGSGIISAKVEPRSQEDAFVAGLLHDNGKIILDRHVRERKALFTEYTEKDGMSFLEAEIQILGFDHAYIAAEACRKWKIPERITKAIRYHHYPSKSTDDLLASVLHLANQVAIISGAGAGAGGDDLLMNLEPGALERLSYTQAEVSELICNVTETLSKLPD